LASMISDSSFLGVYCLEVICWGCFLYFGMKILELNQGFDYVIYLAPPILISCILVSNAFGLGDSAEEFCLPIFMYSIYSVMQTLKEKRKMKIGELVANGVGIGIILWIKYTMLGFYIGLVVFLAIWYLKNKYWNFILKDLIAGITGLVLVSVPVLTYFVFHNALNALWRVYFYNNMFLYPNELNGSRWKRIAECLLGAAFNNKTLVILLILTVVAMLKYRWYENLFIVLSFLGLVSGIYWGGRAYPYYALAMWSYSIFGINLLLGKIKKCIKKSYKKILIAGIILCTLGGVYTFGNNTFLMHLKKENLPQYQFAKIINKQKNPTLLNYGFLDGGFYLAADIIPNSEYFCTLNIPLSEMNEVQNQEIRQGKFDFIVTYAMKLEEYNNVDSSKYFCIDSSNYIYGKDEKRTYFLYKHK
jgi:hypothetical protein